jgi:hypothetical protein
VVQGPLPPPSKGRGMGREISNMFGWVLRFRSKEELLLIFFSICQIFTKKLPAVLVVMAINT